MNKYIMCSLFFFILIGISFGSEKRDSLIQQLASVTVLPADRAEIAFKIGKSFRWSEGALPYFQMMRNTSVAHNLLSREADALEYLGTYYYFQAVLDSSIHYYEWALSRYDRLNDSKKVAEMYNNAGLAKHRQGHFSAALIDYQSGLSINEKILDTAAMALGLNRIGGVFRDQKKYKLALPYYIRSQLLAEDVESYMGMADAIGNQGVIYQRLDSLPLAINKYNQALAISRAHNLKQRIHSCLVNLGDLYLQTGELDKSQKILEEALQVGLGQDPLAHVEINLGKVLFAKKNTQESIRHCEKALQIATSSMNRDRQKDALACLISGYKSMNNADKALFYYEALDQVKDSLYQTSNIAEITKLEMQYNFDQEQERERMISERNKARQLWIRNALIAGLLGLGIIAFLILRLARHRKQANELLTEKNKTIEKALSDKDLLLREIHHRVKNNLQVVSSLLSLQSAYIENEGALEAINEGRDRIQSMALIHQNLYRKDNLTGVEIHSYFGKLISGLFDSYNIHPDRIKLELDIQDLNLDVDTVIPLGLIVNELVSNALKYAFPKDKEGLIKISLIEKDEMLELVVSDNGIGMQDEWKEEGATFGYQLIHAFKEKLEADLEVTGVEGTTILMNIRDYNKAS